MAANGSLSHRIWLPGRRDEFRELADAFDTMLARLEAHVAEEQRFAATPPTSCATRLAITQALLDVARNDLNRGARELVERLRAVNTGRSTSPEALPPAQPGRPASFTREHADLSSWPKKPPKRSSPSRKSAASPSRPAGTSPRSSAHARCCCR